MITCGSQKGNLFSLRNDQQGISPCNVGTVSDKKIVRRQNNENEEISYQFIFKTKIIGSVQEMMQSPKLSQIL